LSDIVVPPAVYAILRKLEDAGFETWCVGGAIRDALLRRETTHHGIDELDWDLATAARPEDVRRLFRRTVPVGIAFGTVGVLDSAGVMHEVTTFRRDVKTDGRHAVVEFGDSIEGDLARRDFTLNAIAFHPDRKEFCDPFDGRSDLARKIVRAVGVPAERMREDRLRALRGIRFASRLRFQLDPETWQAILDSAPHMGRLSAERVKQEMEKTMDQVECPSAAFRLWQSSGAFSTLIPALGDASSVELATPDHLATPIAGARANRRVLRLIALFAAVPAKQVLKVLKDLRFSNSDAAWISSVCSHWQALSGEMAFALAAGSPPPAVLRRWAAITGRTRLASVMRLAAARWAAERAVGMAAPDGAAIHSAYRKAIRVAYRDAVEVADLAIDGTDLAELGISGPAVGQTLRNLLETVITDPGANTREHLLQLARGSAGHSN
jgi:tRNA nucleotidyltransferase (CCA-adding enzyme)